jgi:hypothetical protein
MAGEVMTHLQVAQVFISGGAGLLGVGIGIGMFKSTVKQIRKDIAGIMRKQDILRGEGNGKGIPLFVPFGECSTSRSRCVNIKEGKFELIASEMKEHHSSIKALENFARWWMQKEGLTISEINNILGAKG